MNEHHAGQEAHLSRVVAEALVHRHPEQQVRQRIIATGIPEKIARLLATVCSQPEATVATPGNSTACTQRVG